MSKSITIEPANEIIGMMLRAARLRAGKTLDDVRAATGIDKGQLSKAERGKVPITVVNLIEIAAFLGVSPGSLFPRHGMSLDDARELAAVELKAAERARRTMS